LVDGDPARLAQVFQNLLGNAAKYSEPNSRITLRARVSDGDIVVEVADEGIGISPELLPRLFDLFVQGERTLDRSEGGLGIGLTVVHRLGELHGGTISAHSAGLGRGATFVVRLPRANVAVASPVVTAEFRVVPPGGRARVLVVDDNVDAAEMLGEFLG